MRYLVVHDADTIQQYVFATSRLREIRGASALIDQINRKTTRELVARCEGELIFYGGGGAAADFADQETAQTFCRALSAYYLEHTITASSTGVIVPYDENAPDEDNRSFPSALKQAQSQLRQEKADRARATQMLTGPYLKRCQACGIYSAADFDEKLPEPGQEGRFVCLSCRYKRNQQSRNPRVQRLIDKMVFSRHNIRIKFPREMKNIGDAATPDGYIGVIYADGNRMGDRLLRIKSKSALRGFSKTIDQATQQAIASVLADRWKPSPEDRSLFPVLIPLCGGDDLVVIAPGHQALAIALAFLKAFQDRVRQILPREVEGMIGSREISACAGVAIGKTGVPLSALFDLAKDLCNSAKKRNFDLFQQAKFQPTEFQQEFQQTEGEVPCIDFQVVTTPNWHEVGDVRSQHLQPRKDQRLTCRPYTVNEAEELVKAVQVLKAPNVQFPPGKLHDLYRSLWLGRNQASFEYRTMYARALPHQRKVLRDIQESLKLMLPPWRPWPGRSLLASETPYADIVEIYQFIE